MSDPETVAFYDRAAAGAGGLHADGPPDPVLQRFIDALPPAAAVLDLGCGHGIASAHLARAGHRVTGLDASAALLDVARRLAPDAHFVRGGFDDLDATAAYDGVWANFALLHAPRAAMPDHLAAIARALRPGGLFHLSMLLGAADKRDRHGRAYSYFAQDELDRLLAEAGFARLAVDTGEKTGLDGIAEPFAAYLMRTPA